MFVIHLVRDELGHTSVTLQDAFLICNINISCYTAKFTALFTSAKLRCWSGNHSRFEPLISYLSTQILESKMKTKMPKAMWVIWVIPVEGARNVYRYHETWKATIWLGETPQVTFVCTGKSSRCLNLKFLLEFGAEEVNGSSQRVLIAFLPFFFFSPLLQDARVIILQSRRMILLNSYMQLGIRG